MDADIYCATGDTMVGYLYDFPLLWELSYLITFPSSSYHQQAGKTLHIQTQTQGKFEYLSLSTQRVNMGW